MIKMMGQAWMGTGGAYVDVKRGQGPPGRGYVERGYETTRRRTVEVGHKGKDSVECR